MTFEVGDLVEIHAWGAGASRAYEGPVGMITNIAPRRAVIRITVLWARSGIYDDYYPFELIKLENS